MKLITLVNEIAPETLFALLGDYRFKAITDGIGGVPFVSVVWEEKLKRFP